MSLCGKEYAENMLQIKKKKFLKMVSKIHSEWLNSGVI